MVSEQDKNKLIRLLTLVTKGKLELIDTELGLCRGLKDIVSNYFSAYTFVRLNCKDWSRFSGSPDYPVDGFDGYLHHLRAGTLWQGEQLKLRQSLAQHLLTKLEENTYVL